jgi:hypothetical protein
LPKQKNEEVSYTEEQLKAETLRKREELAKLEARRKPLTPRQAKVSNFWYHYKVHTLSGIAILVLVAFFVRDIVLRVEPDVTVVLMAGRYLTTDTTAALQTALEETAGDFNGDGKVAVAIDPMQITPPAPEQTADTPPESAPADAPMMTGDSEMQYANLMKMSAVIASDSDPIYLLDQEMYDHLLAITADDNGVTQSMFVPMEGVPAAIGESLPFSETVLAEVPGLEVMDGLSFYIRSNRKTDEKDLAYYAYCEEILQTISK